MGKSKKDKQLENFWMGFVYLIIVLAVVYFVWSFLFSDSSESSSKKKEYVSCADDCVIDLDFCKISSVIYDKNRNGYISEVNFDNCKNELESCISDC